MLTQELASDRRTGERLVCRVVEFSHKLYETVTHDSVAHLQTDTAKVSQRFDSLSRDIDAALDDLTGRLAASSDYQNCVDEVQMWLTKAEKDVAQTVSKTELCHEAEVYLEQLRALLMELEGNRSKLDDLERLGKCCGSTEAQHVYDGFCDRYTRLAHNLKVS